MAVAASTHPQDALISIPESVVSHPAFNDHEQVKQFHSSHGGIPASEPAAMAEALELAHKIAAAPVLPGTTRRADPSPRRDARVWRSQLLGTRDHSQDPANPERSPERVRARRDQSTSRPPATAPIPEHASADERGESSASGRASGRARGAGGSKIRAASVLPIPPPPEEEEIDVKHDPDAAGGPPGRRDTYPTPSDQVPDAAGMQALSQRVGTVVQQQHEFHERLLSRIGALEGQAGGNTRSLTARLDEMAFMLDRLAAMNKNKANHYLGIALVPVTNGLTSVPNSLPLRGMHPGDVRDWVSYYTGVTPPPSYVLDEGDPDEGSEYADDRVLSALKVCIGLDGSQ